MSHLADAGRCTRACPSGSEVIVKPIRIAVNAAHVFRTYTSIACLIVCLSCGCWASGVLPSGACARVLHTRYVTTFSGYVSVEVRFCLSTTGSDRVRLPAHCCNNAILVNRCPTSKVNVFKTRLTNQTDKPYVMALQDHLPDQSCILHTR
jgi:hypothetical protein